MADMAAVADKLDIIEVCTRAHWCYDHEAWAALDTVFADTVSMPTVAQVTDDPHFDADTYLSRYLVTREEVKRALGSFKEGLTTQHLIAGHQVTLDGDRAVCLAHYHQHPPPGRLPFGRRPARARQRVPVRPDPDRGWLADPRVGPARALELRG